jgi:hypothetical protein
VFVQVISNLFYVNANLKKIKMPSYSNNGLEESGYWYVKK